MWPFINGRLDDLGLSKTDLARLTGIDPSRLHFYAQGKRPSLENARKLAAVLKVPYLKLLWEAKMITTEELGDRVIVGSQMSLSDFSIQELLTEALQRVASQDVRQTM